MKTELKTLSRSLVVAGLMAGSAFIAVAQTSPMVPGPMAGASAPMMMHDGHRGPARGMHDGKGWAKKEAVVAKHMAELKTKLKITTAQEGSWTTFTTAMKPPARPDMAHLDRAEMEKLTTPERIDKMRTLRAQRMTEHQANMDQRENAVKAFYADLNTDQKKAFDAEHNNMMHRWGDRMKGHGYKGGDRSAPPAPKPQ